MMSCGLSVSLSVCLSLSEPTRGNRSDGGCDGVSSFMLGYGDGKARSPGEPGLWYVTL